MKSKSDKEIKQSALLDELEKAFEKDTDLFLFYVTWIKNGMNATKAYQELHPEVTYQSASVLGSRQLGKVNKNLVLEAYGLDIAKYMQQLKEGLEAEKVNEFDGTLYPDHTTRKPYHDKLGKLLGIEKDKAMIEFNQQNNFIGWDQFIQMMEERKNK